MAMGGIAMNRPAFWWVVGGLVLAGVVTAPAAGALRGSPPSAGVSSTTAFLHTGPTARGAAPADEDLGAPERDVVVVSPLIKTFAAMAGGGPSVVQVLATPVLSRAANLPPEVTGPMFERYVQGVERVTEASAAMRQAAVRLNDGLAPLAPIVNPMARPFGTAVAESAANAFESGGDLAAIGGHHDSFPGWMAGVIRASSRSLGFGAS